MKVATYYRYSTDNKNQVDNSEARQKDSVERVVYSRGWHEVASYTDHAVSGTDNKPQLLELRERIESGELSVDVIAIDSLSRLSRRSARKIDVDIDWIEKAGILLSIASRNSGDPFPVSDLDDDLSLMVDGWQNNQYVKKLSRDVTNGMRVKFEKGQLGWCGQAPYGYDLVRKLDEPSTLRANEDLAVVRKIFKRILDGGSVRSCIELLEQTSKFQKSDSKSPSSTSVKNILRNSIYAGVRTFGVRAVGKHSSIAKHSLNWVAQNPLVQSEMYQEYKAEGFKACITIDEYQRVQQLLDSNQKKFRKNPARCKHDYSGLFRCAKCNSAMVATTFKNKRTGEIKISYVCPKSGSGATVCKEDQAPHRKQIREDELEEMIGREFGFILMNKNFHRNNLSMLVDRLVKRSKSAIAVVEEDFAIQEKRLAELTSLFVETGSASLKEQISKQSEKLDSLRRRKDEAFEVDDVVEFARSQYEAIQNAGGLNNYFGKLYELAATLAAIKNVGEREAAIDNLAGQLGEMLIDAVADIAAKIEVQFGKAAGDAILAGFSVDGSPAAQLAMLRSMGLDHIKVSFRRGLFRGKPRLNPSELTFVFLVTSTNHTDKGVVVNSDRISFCTL